MAKEMVTKWSGFREETITTVHRTRPVREYTVAHKVLSMSSLVWMHEYPRRRGPELYIPELQPHPLLLATSAT